MFSVHRKYPPWETNGELNRKEDTMDINSQQNHKPDMGSTLAMQALDSIPDAKADAVHITGLIKRNGRITGYQLSDGRTVTKEEGVALAKTGDICGVGIAHRGNTQYLKALPDGKEGNNLSNLPTV